MVTDAELEIVTDDDDDYAWNVGETLVHMYHAHARGKASENGSVSVDG